MNIHQPESSRAEHMTLFKSPRSVAPALNNHFLVLTLSEVKLCSIDFRCDRSFPTRGPLWVSWRRDKVVVGGNLRTQQFVLDSEALTPLEDPNRDATRIPAEQTAEHASDGRVTQSIYSADESRLLTTERGHTRWNKLMNPLGGLGDWEYNYEQIVVYDKATKKELFRFRWDPRPGWSSESVAISPTGHKIAIIIRGTLEVFDIQ
jgi:hypothetical protein